jgi:hypothetical protein
MEAAKPSVFIASSKEGLKVADAINLNLDHDTFPTLWRTGTFRPGSSVLDDLVKKSSAVDFAVFVFTPDDAATIREEPTRVVRDNVLFELGLFIGALGKERCYVVRPRAVDMHLPSDLLGVTHVDYAPDRPDGELASALNAACKQIRDEIARHGPIQRSSRSPGDGGRRHVANPPEYSLNKTDLMFLGECAASHTEYPRGLSLFVISAHLGKQSPTATRLSAIKLGRLGYINKSVEVDNDGDEYYAYSITEGGLDVFLQNEAAYSASFHPVPKPARRPAPNFSDMDDDVPF